MALALAACLLPWAAAAGAGTSGTIRGVVGVGPLCPVLPAGPGCPDVPYHGRVAAVAQSGRAYRVRTDLRGRFRIGVPPGRYTVRIEPGTPYPRAAARAVRVRAGAVVRLRIHADSGIR